MVKKVLFLIAILSVAVGVYSFSNQTDMTPTEVEVKIPKVQDQTSAVYTEPDQSPGTKPVRETRVNNDAKSQAVRGESVISTNDKAALLAAIARKGIELVGVQDSESGHSLVTLAQPENDSRIKELEAEIPDLKVGKNYTYRASLTPNDTHYSDQWALPKIAAPSAWDISTGSSSTVIAVIDTGILSSQTFGSGPTTYTQDDFPASKIWTNPGESGGGKDTNDVDDDGNGKVDDWQGWDFMGGFVGNNTCPNYDSSLGDVYIQEDNDPQPYSCDNFLDHNQLNKTHFVDGCGYASGACSVGHATSVASVAAAASNNSKIVAGVNHNAKLMNLRVLDGYGVGDTAGITAAVQYATAKGANVINLSLALDDCSSSFSDSLLDSALAEAKANGIIIVAAAGNEAASHVCYPASSPYVVAVGASDQNDNAASFSNAGSNLDIVAPGVDVAVANAPSSFANFDYLSAVSGTSLSTPYISGLASLVRNLNPASSADDVIRFILSNTDKVSGMSGATWTSRYGFGRVNAWMTLKYATVAHPDGTLVKHPEGPAIFFIENGQLKYIPQAEVFFSRWGNVDGRVKPITPSDFKLPSAGEVSWQEGTLIKGSGPAVYCIEKKIGGGLVKRRIGSPTAYQQLGYSDSDRLGVPDGLLNAISTDADITENDRHPYGTLVQVPGQPTVYMIDAGQKRYVPQTSILQSLNKGKIKVFAATAADVALPNGAQVEFAEGALVRDTGNQAIYVIDYSGSSVVKRRILSPIAFNHLGYNEADVINAPSDHLPIGNGSPID